MKYVYLVIGDEDPILVYRDRKSAEKESESSDIYEMPAFVMEDYLPGIMNDEAEKV